MRFHTQNYGIIFWVSAPEKLRSASDEGLGQTELQHLVGKSCQPLVVDVGVLTLCLAAAGFLLRLNPKGPSTQLSCTLKNSNLHNYYPKPEYLIIGSFGPLG